jgi:WD40-like Beta Propeller Repeat
VLGDFRLSEPRAIAELNTPDLVEAGPSIAHSGLEIFFFRGPTVFDIFTATRSDPAALWSTPVRIDAPVSSEFNDQSPRLSTDGKALLFVSARPVPGAPGGLHIWMSTREKLHGQS